MMSVFAPRTSSCSSISPNSPIPLLFSSIDALVHVMSFLRSEYKIAEDVMNVVATCSRASEIVRAHWSVLKPGKAFGVRKQFMAKLLAASSAMPSHMLATLKASPPHLDIVSDSAATTTVRTTLYTNVPLDLPALFHQRGAAREEQRGTITSLRLQLGGVNKLLLHLFSVDLEVGRTTYFKLGRGLAPLVVDADGWVDLLHAFIRFLPLPEYQDVVLNLRSEGRDIAAPIVVTRRTTPAPPAAAEDFWFNNLLALSPLSYAVPWSTWCYAVPCDSLNHVVEHFTFHIDPTTVSGDIDSAAREAATIGVAQFTIVIDRQRISIPGWACIRRPILSFGAPASTYYEIPIEKNLDLSGASRVTVEVELDRAPTQMFGARVGARTYNVARGCGGTNCLWLRY
jgi:hypothetical protein